MSTTLAFIVAVGIGLFINSVVLVYKDKGYMFGHWLAVGFLVSTTILSFAKDVPQNPGVIISAMVVTAGLTWISRIIGIFDKFTRPSEVIRQIENLHRNGVILRRIFRKRLRAKGFEAESVKDVLGFYN